MMIDEVRDGVSAQRQLGVVVLVLVLVLVGVVRGTRAGDGPPAPPGDSTPALTDHHGVRQAGLNPG